jgi:Domain of unknown function (DUF3597)
MTSGKRPKKHVAKIEASSRCPLSEFGSPPEHARVTRVVVAPVPNLRAVAQGQTRGNTMSIFGKLVSAIFGSSEPAPTSWSPSSPSSPASPSTPTGSSTAAGAPEATGKPMSRAELEELIKKTASQQHEDLNWRESIVDLMKLFKLDSNLGARKELAKELGYTGALDGSAEMNMWLHRQVMTKLAETGGKVPEHLKA